MKNIILILAYTILLIDAKRSRRPNFYSLVYGNECTCPPSDMVCISQCVQNRILTQAQEHISCSVGCQLGGTADAANCLLGCQANFYSKITEPVLHNIKPTPTSSKEQEDEETSDSDSESESKPTPTPTETETSEKEESTPTEETNKDEESSTEMTEELTSTSTEESSTEKSTIGPTSITESINSNSSVYESEFDISGLISSSIRNDINILSTTFLFLISFINQLL